MQLALDVAEDARAGRDAERAVEGQDALVTVPLEEPGGQVVGRELVRLPDGTAEQVAQAARRQCAHTRRLDAAEPSVKLVVVEHRRQLKLRDPPRATAVHR